jgi:hypothetical protein
LTTFRELQLGTGNRPLFFTLNAPSGAKKRLHGKNKSLSEGETKFKTVFILIHQKEWPTENDEALVLLLQT